MKNIVLFCSAIAALNGFSDTWGQAEAWVYSPRNHGGYSEVTYFTAYDGKGNSANIEYKGGIVNADSLRIAIDTLRLSVNSVFENMAYLAGDIISIDTDVAMMDKALTDLNAKLNNVFAEIFGKLDTISMQETVPGGSGVSASSYNIVGKSENKITIVGGMKSLDVDNFSINVKDKSEYQLYGFSQVSAGGIPHSQGSGKSLLYTFPRFWFDGASISVDVDGNNLPSTSGNNHGIHMAGWYAPGTGDHYCNPNTDSLAKQLQDGENTHYVLTQLKNGGKLHYTEIGQFSNLVGNASIRFVGTDGIGKGPLDAKTTVRFASASDSNVSVIVDGSDTNITVTIGVNWKAN